jgi:hypothetical protein
MTNWLLLFKDETYKTVRKHMQIGVLDQHRRRFANVSAGDRFVAYLSQPGRVDGHGRFTGDPFETAEPLWGSREKKVAGSKETVTVPRYPRRCTVAFDQADVARTAGNLLWHLHCWPEQMTTSPGNYMFLRGGFTAISDADYHLLRAVLDGGELPIDKA